MARVCSPRPSKTSGSRVLGLSGAFDRTRYNFGSGGDTPNTLASASRLAKNLARDSPAPPEPGLLDSLRRDREHHWTVVVDRLSLIVSPTGLMSAATAAVALRLRAREALSATDNSPTPRPWSSASSSHSRGGSARSRNAFPQARRPLVLRPSVSTSVHLQVEEMWSMLSLEGRPLVSSTLRGLAFQASVNQWWERNSDGDAQGLRGAGQAADAASSPPNPPEPRDWPRWWSFTEGREATALRYLWLRLHGLAVSDLTTDGQLHNEVISHATSTRAMSGPGTAPDGVDRASSTYGRRRRSQEKWSSWSAGGGAAATAASTGSFAERLPTVVLELVPAHDGVPGVCKVNVRSLRLCYLRRFTAEVVKYFGPDGLGPVFDLARSLLTGVGDGGGGVAESDEDEEEKVSVVLGEEDSVLPDDWLFGSSETGRTADEPRSQQVTGGDVEAGRQAGGDRAAPGGDDGRRSSSSDGVDSQGDEGASVRVTAVLQDLTVIVPRNTHSREAAALRCDELVLEVRPRWMLEWRRLSVVGHRFGPVPELMADMWSTAGKWGGSRSWRQSFKCMLGGTRGNS